ncbi:MULTISPECIES: hypothetical protein [unclassified Streptomyces]|uniref:hypothetical protein n=1 Tax=unclassified Streptomyces TaxID=2593676 RepID=UPI002034DA15|nr:MULTISPECIES: hypothetical protein [unclassified Streptomyces]
MKLDDAQTPVVAVAGRPLGRPGQVTALGESGAALHELLGLSARSRANRFKHAA